MGYLALHEYHGTVDDDRAMEKLRKDLEMRGASYTAIRAAGGQWNVTISLPMPNPKVLPKDQRSAVPLRIITAPYTPTPMKEVTPESPSLLPKAVEPDG